VDKRKRFTLKKKNARPVFKIEEKHFGAREKISAAKILLWKSSVSSVNYDFCLRKTTECCMRRARAPQDLWTNRSINVDGLWKLCYNGAQCLDVS